MKLITALSCGDVLTSLSNTLNILYSGIALDADWSKLVMTMFYGNTLCLT